MSYKNLHKTILERSNWNREQLEEARTDKEEVLDEKAASNDTGEDYDAEDPDEIDPHKSKDAKTDKNKSSIETKGTNDSIAEEDEKSTISESSLNELTRLFGGRPPITEDKITFESVEEEKDDDDKKKKDKKNPEKVKDKIDTTPEVDDEDPMGESVVNEEELSDAEEKKKEEIVKKLKEKKDEFQKKYGDRWESVMYATATKMAKKSVDESLDKSLEKRAQSARSANARAQSSVAAKFARKRKKKRAKKESVNEASYDSVFKAIAKHMGVDSDKIDELDKDKKKKFFDTLEKCWDEDSNSIPDGCPINIGEASDFNSQRTDDPEREKRIEARRKASREAAKKARKNKSANSAAGKRARKGPMGGYD